MQNLPFAYADASVAALMTLVAVMTTKELHLSLMVESDTSIMNMLNNADMILPFFINYPYLFHKENLDMSAVNKDGPLLLQFIQTAQQRIFLNTEVVGQFLPRQGQEDIFGLLLFALLLQIQAYLFTYTHGEHTYLLGQQADGV